MTEKLSHPATISRYQVGQPIRKEKADICRQVEDREKKMIANRDASQGDICSSLLSRTSATVSSSWRRMIQRDVWIYGFMAHFPDWHPICFSSKQTSLRVELNFARTVALRSEKSNVCSFSMLMRLLDIIHLDHFLGTLFENQFFRKAKKLVWKRFLFGCVANRGAFSILQLQKM